MHCPTLRLFVRPSSVDHYFAAKPRLACNSRRPNYGVSWRRGKTYKRSSICGRFDRLIYPASQHLGSEQPAGNENCTLRCHAAGATATRDRRRPTAYAGSLVAATNSAIPHAASLQPNRIFGSARLSVIIYQPARSEGAAKLNHHGISLVEGLFDALTSASSSRQHSETRERAV